MKNKRHGEKLRQVMKKQNVNVPWLHEKTKIPTNTLYDWFNGRVSPKATTVKAVAEKLKVSTDELID